MGVFLIAAAIGLPVVAFVAQLIGALVAFPVVLGFHGLKAIVTRHTGAVRHTTHA
ncbi:hypothetical protein [Burkholderia pseudomallei]|uniref:hypothetical protein n=1 Tax=Burkholderia pseudomallei TaxID=28450 RepID=UPI000F11ED27|nr:hypothetical protein [Burkholderia pseudomallei]VBQ36128.1 Uncharacterised protein [Burkholderia pseudomallei]